MANNFINLTLMDAAVSSILNSNYPKKATKYFNMPASDSMLDDVFFMRHKSYSSKKFIAETASKKFIDEYDYQPNCLSFLTYCNNEPIGSIRACLFDPEKPFSIPVMDVFDNELQKAIGYNDKIVEANKFVIEPSFQRSGGVKARFSVFRNIADYVIESNAQYIAVGVRSEHIRFYTKLCFRPASDLKPYPHLKFKTALMICEDINLFCEKIYTKTISI